MAGRADVTRRKTVSGTSGRLVYLWVIGLLSAATLVQGAEPDLRLVSAVAEQDRTAV
jgi:hypothetical protein